MTGIIPENSLLNTSKFQATGSNGGRTGLFGMLGADLKEISASILTWNFDLHETSLLTKGWLVLGRDWTGRGFFPGSAISPLKMIYEECKLWDTRNPIWAVFFGWISRTAQNVPTEFCLVWRSSHRLGTSQFNQTHNCYPHRSEPESTNGRGVIFLWYA